MKILIIDDSPDFRAVVSLYLTRHLPQAQLVEYELERLGKPGPEFDWSGYEVLLLDYNLGGGENGFNWLQEFSTRKNFPPTIILTAEGDEYIAVRAIKLGAADYLNKVDLTPRRLVDAIINASQYTTVIKAAQEKEKIAAEHLVQKLRAQSVAGKKKSVLPDIGAGYKFVRLIGAGAMSRVYLAERASDGLSLVLKILDLKSDTQDTLVTRFVQEAELISRLSSPFVVKIYDYGLTNDYAFIAIEFFTRGDLKQRMELHPGPEIALNYLTHIAYGLDAVHKIGIVHRDLKPANIMFRGDDTLVLADFGIAKKLNTAFNITTLGQILGSPHYISPEQGAGRPLDGRADIYSAGIILYELLTRQKPYTGSTPAALIYQHIHSPVPELPGELARYQDLINRTMSKDPAHRYDAPRLILALEAALEG